MLVMRELSDKFKLSARSVGEVLEAINSMVSRARTTGEPVYHGKNLTREALVNAVILYVDSLPPREKVRAIVEGVRRLELILEAEPGAVDDVVQGSGVVIEPKRKARGVG